MNTAADRLPHLPNVTALWFRWSQVMNHRAKSMSRTNAEVSTTEDMVNKVPFAFQGINFTKLLQAFRACEAGQEIPLYLLLYHDPRPA